MKGILRRKARAFVAGFVIVAVVAFATALVFVSNHPAHASGSGSGGCTASQTSTCQFTGLSAFAQFEGSSDGCVYSGANVYAFQDILHGPPDAPTTQTAVFLGVQSFDCNTGNWVSASGESSDITFTVDNHLKSAHLVATVPVTDDYTGNPAGTITVNVTWQGYGLPAQQIDNSHFRTSGMIFSTHYTGDNESATASGTVSDGTTNYAAMPTMFNDIQSVRSGTISITRL